MSRRVFFPRDVQNADGIPFLQAVARRLVEEAAEPGSKSLAMDRFVCVLPGSRAIRILDAYIARTVYAAIDADRFDSDWTPPLLLRVGEAPEKLYEPTRREANGLASLYCERRALATFLTTPKYRDAASRLFPRREGENEEKFEERLRSLAESSSDALKLAQTFLSLDQKLAGERKTPLDVAIHCERKGLVEESRRWSALDKLKKLYRAELDAVEMTDRNDAREDALKRGAIGSSTFDFNNGSPRRYFIVGATDLDRQQKDVFQALGDRVQFWIYAPVDSASGAPKTSFDLRFESRPEDFFDECGCVVPERWDPTLGDDDAKLILPIPESNFFQVDDPPDQGRAVAELTRELSIRSGEARAKFANEFYDPIEPEQLSICAPDPEVVPFVEDQMSELGYATIRGEGTPAIHNRVYRTMELFADYLETRSYDALGELLRRPDVERWLLREWDKTELERAPEERRSAEEFQSELDAARDAEEDERAAEEAETGGDARRAENATARELWLQEYDDYRATFVPTRVDGHWFRKLDAESSFRNRFYSNLRKASRMIDDALDDFFDGGRSYLYNGARKPGERSGVDPLSDPVDAMRVDAQELDLENVSLYGNVLFATRQKKLPLREWTGPVSRLASAIYADENVSNLEELAQIDGFFQFFNQGLDSLDAVPDFGDSDRVSGSFAIRTLLSLVAGKSVPPPPGAKVVEIQGWLDLFFDDAPYCILTGFNEGSIPSTQSGDLFLPNATRSALGLVDANRVFARDAYLAYALAKSRSALFVVFEKRSLDKNPRLPSRLLFATEEKEIPPRVVRYFGERGEDAFKALVRRHADRDFPRGVKEDAPKDKPGGFRAPTLNLTSRAPIAPSLSPSGDRSRKLVMNVTDFETFLKSPYVFFLKKTFRLNPAPRKQAELSALEFGNIAHAVLRAFGNDEKMRDATDKFVVYQFLSDRLDEITKESINEYTSPFVRVQIEELRARFRSFASWQAKWRQSGRVIKYVEAPASLLVSELGVAGRPLRDADSTEIVGRVDRIDYCPKEDRWYVFDYKTHDKAERGKKDKDVEFETVSTNDETNEILLTSYPGNTVDTKHREKVNFDTLFPSSRVQLNPDVDLSNQEMRWINLQLPLYRHFLRKIVGRRDLKTTLGYLALKSGSFEALGAPWSEENLRNADATCRWVVDSIWQFFKRGVVDPDGFADEDFLPILDCAKLKFDDYAPITRSYLSSR